MTNNFHLLLMLYCFHKGSLSDAHVQRQLYIQTRSTQQSTSEQSLDNSDTGLLYKNFQASCAIQAVHQPSR